jgi:hypothetical protein
MLYNPINMKIEDENRLYERDLREKNKKKRFEIRYDVEAATRKEGLAETVKRDVQALNKISKMRFKEEIERGHDIITNDDLTGPNATKNVHMPAIRPERGVWTRALATVNRDFMTVEERQRVEREEEEKAFRETSGKSDFELAAVEQRRARLFLAQIADAHGNLVGAGHER